VKGFLASGNLGRFLEAEHRPQPPYYYLVVLLVGFLPWSAFLPGALVRALRSGGDGGGNLESFGDRNRGRSRFRVSIRASFEEQLTPNCYPIRMIDR